jgi:NAD-dependent DNA ligase
MNTRLSFPIRIRKPKPEKEKPRKKTASLYKFEGKLAVFTGKFRSGTRSEMERIMKYTLHGFAQSNITQQVDYLIISDEDLANDHWSTKRAKASDYGITEISETEFYKAVWEKNNG